MTKKYRINSKFRFTLFIAVIILCLFTTVGTVFGFNNANGAAFNQYYVVEVESGDTLWNIASEYGPDDKDVRQVVHDICDVNEIDADHLEAGEKIVVPVYH